MNRRPIVFGEVLFDVFPDGTRVLGGAPFNVAWHLQGFGLRPIFISRIGDDADGAEILTRMRAWGMDETGIQIDKKMPTGRVDVTIEGGEPRFAVAENVAWDAIDADTASAAMQKESLLYHGTLAARSPVSARALERLRQNTRAPIFVDVNLRPPWDDQTLVQELVRGANWIKMNGHEWRMLAKSEDSLNVLSEKRFMSATGADWLIRTGGAAGAEILTASGSSFSGVPPAKVESGSDNDTVGAGDAFSAMTIFGLLSGWPPAEMLRNALAFAAAICARRGATHADPSLYSEF
jgi:fructokinase